MQAIIKTRADLAKFTDEYNDYNPELTYLSQNDNEDCYAIFGCTSASEAFELLNGDFNLVVSDKDYTAEINHQTSQPNPELSGFSLK